MQELHAPPVATVHVVLVGRVAANVLLHELAQLRLGALRHVLLEFEEDLRPTRSAGAKQFRRQTA